MRTPPRLFHLLIASGAMLVGFAAPGATRAQEPAPPSLYALLPAEARSPGSTAAAASRRVRQGVRGGAIAASPRLRVPLPNGRVIDVQRLEQRSLDQNGHYWRGQDGGDRTARVRVVTRGSVVVATIEADGRTYLLAPDATGAQILDDITTTGVRCGGAVVPAVPLIAPGGGAAAAPSQAVSAALGEPTVELLVVHSSETRVAAGGADAMRATVELAVEVTNEALANSLVPARLRLVDVREVAYVESRSLSIDLDRVTEIGDGAMDDVHAWRDAAGADLVSLVVERNDAELEGIAWLMQSPSVDFAPNAFSVVMRRTAVSLTLAHEVGHNLGLVHDPDNADVPGAYPYAQGYRDPPYFRDVMSYPCSGTPCPLVPYFSTPDVLYAGRPMGDADQDNARALRQTMPVAAAFRAGAPPTLTGVSPTTIGTLGGAQVTLQGTRLSAVVRVLVDGVPATDLVALPSGSLTVIMPRHPQGPATITIEDYAGAQVSRPAAVTYVASTADLDGDALEDDWERAMGLDPTSSDGAAGAAGDPDGDGLSNLRERVEHGHPRGQYRRYFAEGSQGAFFATQLALLNPGSSATGAVVRVLGANGTVRSLWRDVPGRTRRTLTATDFATLGVDEFSIVVESASPLVVDRTMSWAAEPYGAHAESSVAAPALRWFLAEGATTGSFNLFYLLQNPNAQAAQVRVRYLRQSGPPLERTYLLTPSSRTNVWVNQELFPGLGRALAAAELSADIEVLNGQPIVVERAMYRDVAAQPFGAGHVSAAATTADTEWFMAEGATGAWFDFFILIANPSATAATAEVTYLLPDGSTIVRTHVVAGASRYTIWVDQEDARLADTAVSASVRIANDVPVVVERSMWWPNGSTSWHEAHNAVASRTTATRWALAEGEVGGTSSRDTYVLVANTSGVAGSVDVTLLFEDGTTAKRTFVVLARSRFNVDVRSEFPLAAGRRFGVLVESTGGTPVQLVVERAMYSDAAGQRWAAGTSALATPLP
jgi:hypothetical protein